MLKHSLIKSKKYNFKCKIKNKLSSENFIELTKVQKGLKLSGFQTNYSQLKNSFDKKIQNWATFKFENNDKSNAIKFLVRKKFFKNFRVDFNKKPVAIGYYKNLYRNSLIGKQKLKLFNGRIRNNQLKSIFSKAHMASKSSFPRQRSFNNKFLSLMECRLEVLLYRIFFVPTLFAGRQLINHKKVLINGKIVKSSNLLVKKNDVIELIDPIKTKFWVDGLRDRLAIKHANNFGQKKGSKFKVLKRIWPPLPPYVEINYKTLTAVLVNNELKWHEFCFQPNFSLNLNSIKKFYTK